MYIRSSLARDAEVDRLETAHRLGKEAGLEEGRAEGRAEGLAEGKTEGHKQAVREIAKKMKDEEVPIPTISRCTGLTKGEIDKL